MRFTITLLLTALTLSGTPTVLGLIRDIDSSVDGLLHQEGSKEPASREPASTSFRDAPPRENPDRDTRDTTVERRQMRNSDYRLSASSPNLYPIPSYSGPLDGHSGNSPFSKGFQTNSLNTHRINSDPSAIKPYALQGRTIRNADYHANSKEVPGHSSATKYPSSSHYQNTRPSDNDRYENRMKQDYRNSDRTKNLEARGSQDDLRQVTKTGQSIVGKIIQH